MFRKNVLAFHRTFPDIKHKTTNAKKIRMQVNQKSPNLTTHFVIFFQIKNLKCEGLPNTNCRTFLNIRECTRTISFKQVLISISVGWKFVRLIHLVHKLLILYQHIYISQIHLQIVQYQGILNKNKSCADRHNNAIKR